MKPYKPLDKKTIAAAVESHLSNALPYLFSVEFRESINGNYKFHMYCNGLEPAEMAIAHRYLLAHPRIMGVLRTENAFWFYATDEWAIGLGLKYEKETA